MARCVLIPSSGYFGAQQEAISVGITCRWRGVGEQQVDMGEIYIIPEGAAEVHIGPLPPPLSLCRRALFVTCATASFIVLQA